MIIGIIFFVIIILILVLATTIVKIKLLPTSDVTLTVNGEKFIVPSQNQLLHTLSNNGLFIPSACGGSGTCGFCKVKLITNIVHNPLEETILSKKDIRENIHLACQTMITKDLEISLPALKAKKVSATLKSANLLTSSIKELVFKLSEPLDINAGEYIQIEAPPFKLPHLESKDTVIRGYSASSYKDGLLTLNIRLATSPAPNILPGIVSSYLFSLPTKSTVSMYGPFGDFFIRDSLKELIFIAGGVGIAPIKMHIYDQLVIRKNTAKISLWFGVRNNQELFYQEDFNKLQKEYPNFSWHSAFSDNKIFIHEYLRENYLKNHLHPEKCSYYICGPPIMTDLTREMIYQEGVEFDEIFSDSF